MMTDGEAHHNFYIDILGNFSYKSYKTSVTFVLFKLTEKYDGLSMILINAICDLIEYIASGSLDELKKGNIEYNLPFPRDFILLNKEDILIDTCFFLCNALCTNFTKCRDFKRLKEILGKYYLEIFYINGNENLSPNFNHRLSQFCCKEKLVKDKIMFFTGLYSEVMFLELQIIEKTPIAILTPGFEPVLKNIISLLFQGLMEYDNCPGSSFQACFSLKNIFSIYVLKPYFDSIFDNVFTQLYQGIETIDLFPYFDLLFEILNVKTVAVDNTTSNASALIKEIGNDYQKRLNKKPFNKIQLSEIVKACVNRFLSEFKKSNNNKVIFYKCLQILTLLSEKYVTDCTKIIVTEDDNKSLTPNQFEILIQNLVVYLKNPKKITFENELINIIVNIQKFSPVILESTYLAFSNIGNLIENDGFDVVSYNLIYEMLDKGKEYFNQNILQCLNENNENQIDKLITVLKISYEGGDENESEQILITLIFQKIVQVSYLMIFISIFILLNLDL